MIERLANQADLQAQLVQGVCIEASKMSELNPTLEPQRRLGRNARKHWDQQENTNNNHFHKVTMDIDEQNTRAIKLQEGQAAGTGGRMNQSRKWSCCLIPKTIRTRVSGIFDPCLHQKPHGGGCRPGGVLHKPLPITVFGSACASSEKKKTYQV